MQFLAWVQKLASSGCASLTLEMRGPIGVESPSLDDCSDRPLPSVRSGVVSEMAEDASESSTVTCWVGIASAALRSSLGSSCRDQKRSTENHNRAELPKSAP